MSADTDCVATTFTLSIPSPERKRGRCAVGHATADERPAATFFGNAFRHMMHSWPLVLALSVLITTGGLASVLQAQGCPVNHAASTDGEKALAREDAAHALQFSREAIAKEPGTPQANLGLVRALVLQDDTAEAIEAANAFLAK